MKKSLLYLTIMICSRLISAEAGNTWTSYENVTAFGRGGACFAVEDTIWVGLGFTGSYYDNVFRRYVVSEDKWSYSGKIPGRGRAYGATFMLDGYAYTGLGWTGDVPSAELQDFYKYDHAKGKWEKMADFPSEVTDHVQYFSIGNKAYVCGGLDIATPVTQMWEYDPGKNEWTEKSRLPSGVGRGTAFAIGRYGYVLTGYGPKQTRNRKLYRYDAEADVWDDLGEIPLPFTQWAYAFSANGKGYIGGGWVNLNGFDWITGSSQFWEFDPEGNIFRRLQNSPAAIYGSMPLNYKSRMLLFDGSASQARFMEYMPSGIYMVTDSLSSYKLCEDSLSAKVYFSYDKPFEEDNIFQVELRRESGATTPVIIAAEGTSSPIEFQLPAEWQEGDNYRVRIRSTAPEVLGTHHEGYLSMRKYPPAPFLQLEGDSLFSNAFYTHYWYRNGEPYDTTMTRYLKLTEPGIYKEYVSAGCASGFSNEVQYTGSGVEEKHGSGQVAIDQNSICWKGTGPCDAAVFDLAGRRVRSYELPEGGKADIGSLRPGCYYLRISSRRGGNVSCLAFVKN